LIGPGCILAILLRLRRPLRLRLLLLLGLLRLWLLLLRLLLLWRRWRLLRIGSLLLLLLRLLRRLVRVPALRRSGLLVVHVAHGCWWRQRRRSEARRDGEVVRSIAIGRGRMRRSTMA
jgi:hypothetical protein